MLIEQKVPDAVREKLVGSRGLRVFTMGGCSIILGREDPNGAGTALWHLSISHPSRHPTWDEIKTARYRLLPPEIDMAMHLPPPQNYVNVEEQDHVFQMWECRDPNEPWNDR